MQEPKDTTFLTLVRFTSEGRTKLTAWPQIYERLEQELDTVGGGIINVCGAQGAPERPAVFGAIGRYDYVVIARAPSLQRITQAWLPLVTSGLIATETIALIPGHEFNAMVQEVGEPVSVH